jgi:hypothetical protein
MIDTVCGWFGNCSRRAGYVVSREPGRPPRSAMGVTKGRVSQIEQGKISGLEVLARYAAALGGRLHQSIYFDDGDIAAIA